MPIINTVVVDIEITLGEFSGSVESGGVCLIDKTRQQQMEEFV
jgi:hypothetical protein